MRRIKQLAAMERVGDAPLIEDPDFREKLAAVEVELKALEMTQLRVVADERKREKGQAEPGLLDPEAEGLGDPAATDRAADGGGRARTRCRYQRDYERPQRADGRARLRDRGGADVLQLPQSLDLRRLERDPAQHHRQGDPGL